MRKKRKHGDNGVVVATAIITVLFVISAGYLIGGDNVVTTLLQKETEEKAFYFLSTNGFDDVTMARQNAEHRKATVKITAQRRFRPQHTWSTMAMELPAAQRDVLACRTTRVDAPEGIQTFRNKQTAESWQHTDAAHLPHH